MTPPQAQEIEHDDAKLQATIEEIRKGGTIDTKLRDAEETPLFAATFDPDEADAIGFFIEDAITPEEAEDAALDNR